jgi:glycosyltransferase involved in cell wall biosynthesis
MRVVFFQRKPYPHQFSIEKVFEGVRHELAKDASVTVEVKVMPYYSTGILPRIKNIWWTREHQGDINHITGDVHYIALGLMKHKTILTIHDLNFLDHPNPIIRWLLKLFWITLPLKCVSYITVISEATCGDLLRITDFAKDRIKVIPNYYDQSFRPVHKNFNIQQPRILQIGTKSNKNVSRLIEVLEGISCHLVIVGAASESLKDNLKRAGISFAWLQNLSDKELKEQYALCDILCFVSTKEGFGMPILEAQATGRVVVTSNISSLPEVAGDAAVYVDPFDLSSIRKGILKVINDTPYRNDLIRIGYANVKRFELDKVAGMYRGLYQAIHSKSEFQHEEPL